VGGTVKAASTGSGTAVGAGANPAVSTMASTGGVHDGIALAGLGLLLAGEVGRRRSRRERRRA
jgi:hypothetical protein